MRVWQVSRRSVLTASERHCCTISVFFLAPWRESLLDAGLLDWLFPPHQGMVSKAPVPLKFVILSTHGTQTGSMGLFAAMVSGSAETSSL